MRKLSGKIYGIGAIIFASIPPVPSPPLSMPLLSPFVSQNSGKSLSDDKSLASYSIEAGKTIHMVLTLRGGFM